MKRFVCTALIALAMIVAPIAAAPAPAAAHPSTEAAPYCPPVILLPHEVTVSCQFNGEYIQPSALCFLPPNSYVSVLHPQRGPLFGWHSIHLSCFNAYLVSWSLNAF